MYKSAPNRHPIAIRPCWCCTVQQYLLFVRVQSETRMFSKCRRVRVLLRPQQTREPLPPFRNKLSAIFHEPYLTKISRPSMLSLNSTLSSL